MNSVTAARVSGSGTSACARRVLMWTTRGAAARASGATTTGIPAISPISRGEIRPEPQTLMIPFGYAYSMSRQTMSATASVDMN